MACEHLYLLAGACSRISAAMTPHSVMTCLLSANIRHRRRGICMACERLHHQVCAHRADLSNRAVALGDDMLFSRERKSPRARNLNGLGCLHLLAGAHCQDLRSHDVALNDDVHFIRR